MSPVFEHVPLVDSFTPPRFRVQRLDPDGVLHEAYAGDDGTKAVEAIEAYRASVLYGEFTILDTHYPDSHRGLFVRAPQHNES